MSILYVSIILGLRIIQSYVSKCSSDLLPKSWRNSTKYFVLMNFVAAILALILVVIEHSFSEFNLLTIVISLLSGISLTASSVFGLLAMKSGTVVLSSMFATAGLLVPCIAGIFLFQETMSIFQWCGLLIFLIASYLLIGASKKIYPTFSIKTILLLVGAMLANGFTMLFQKLFSYYVPKGSVSLFSFLTFGLPTLILAGIIFFSKSTSQEKPLSNSLGKYAAISAGVVFGINQLATLSARMMPSVVLFSLINGGGTIIATIVAAVYFKEKLNVRSVAGIILGIGALIMIKAL